MTDLHVIAMPPDRLDKIRANGVDEHGNPFRPYPAEGGEPLRCCLIRAAAGDTIALISYSPFTERSPWAEVGPVYVHAEACTGYRAAADLPSALRTGPRVLRTYHADGSLDYGDITYVGEHDDLEPALRDLLGRPAVAKVHVRTSLPQCFLYEVRRS